MEWKRQKATETSKKHVLWALYIPYPLYYTNSKLQKEKTMNEKQWVAGVRMEVKS